MPTTFMLDTNICSFIMREKPQSLLAKLSEHVRAQDRIVISAITYSEMRFGSIGPKASPRHAVMVSEFVKRLHEVVPWDAAAVDATTAIRLELGRLGTPIGPNDSAIAGHAVAMKCVLVTNNTREFCRVDGLSIHDWTVPWD